MGYELEALLRELAATPRGTLTLPADALSSVSAVLEHRRHLATVRRLDSPQPR